MLTVDGAGSHQVGDKQHVPGNITLLRLPPLEPRPLTSLAAQACRERVGPPARQ